MSSYICLDKLETKVTKLFFQNWWACEKKTENGREVGLAPRTYLALYPALCYRKRWAINYRLMTKSMHLD